MNYRRDTIRKFIFFIAFVVLVIILFAKPSTGGIIALIAAALTSALNAGSLITTFEWFRSFFFQSTNVASHNLRKQILDEQKSQWIDKVFASAVSDKLIDVKFDADAKFMQDIHKLASDLLAEKHVKESNHYNENSNLFLQQEEQKERFKLGTIDYTIYDAFCASGKQLIILGEGGSGKTIALLGILRILHDEAQGLLTGNIPVVFKLSSWAHWVKLEDNVTEVKNNTLTENSSPKSEHFSQEDLSLEIWLLKELEEIFRDIKPPTRILKDLIKGRRIIFLLDGFDEVPENLLQQLFHEICKFVSPNDQAYSTQFILTSRLEEFEAIQVNFSRIAGKSITLREIDNEDIQNYLADVKYQKIRDLIFEPQSKLRDYAQRPFILNALAEAFQDRADLQDLRSVLENPSDTNTISGSGMKSMPRIILSTYVEQQFNRKTDAANTIGDYDYDRQTAKKYLSWIAHQPLKEVQSGIFVEQLQPSWLKDGFWYWAYILTSRAIGAASIAVGVGFFLSGPLNYIFFGLIAGLTIGVLDRLLPYGGWQKRQSPFKNVSDLIKNVSDLIIRIISVYVLCSIVLSILLGRITPSPSEDLILGGWVSLTGITLAWFLPLFFATIYTTRNLEFKLTSDINPVEKLKFEIRTFLYYAIAGGITVGLIVAVFARLLSIQQFGTSARWLVEFTLVGIPWVNQLTVGFLVGFVFGGMIAGIFGLLKITTVVEMRQRPNHGIRLSILNAVRVATSLAFFFGSVLGLGLWHFYNNDMYGLYRGICNGLGIGILGGLWYGGIDTIHHVILRFFLFASGCTPWRLAHFLRYCCNLNLMREIGASYSFSHDYLRLYFKDTKAPQPKVRKALVLILPGLMLLCASINIVCPSMYEQYEKRFLILSGNNSFKISGRTTRMANGLPFRMKAGQEVSIESRGQIYTGPFLGYVTPEGTNVGVLGLPIGNVYNVAPKLRSNALLCKLDTEQEWQACAKPVNFVFPWSSHIMKFKASKDGLLIFDINEIEVAKRNGYYYAQITKLQ
jgi:hypothetical protein